MSFKTIFRGEGIGVPQDVKDMLIPGEEIFYSVRQARIEQPIAPDEVFITSERVIIRRPHILFYMKTLRDYRYTDMSNVTIHTGFFNSTIRVKMRFMSHNLELRSIPSNLANKISGIIQEGIDGRFTGYGEKKNVDELLNPGASGRRSGVDNSLNILRERYARGELTREQYLEIKKDLM